MATTDRETLLRKVYNDYRNYPYGFSRSGDFSIRESDALVKYGSLISALTAGEVEPTVEEDRNILAVIAGEKEAETLVEKAWVKYQQRINRPRVKSMYGRSKAVADSDFDDSDSTEDDLVMED